MCFFVSLTLFFFFINSKAIRCHDVPNINTSKCDRTQKYNRFLINEVVHWCDRLYGGHCCCHLVYLIWTSSPLAIIAFHTTRIVQQSNESLAIASQVEQYFHWKFVDFLFCSPPHCLLFFDILLSCCVRTKRKLFSRFDDDRGILSVDLIAFNFPFFTIFFEKFKKKKICKPFIIYWSVQLILANQIV